MGSFDLLPLDWLVLGCAGNVHHFLDDQTVKGQTLFR